jgi:hypothetical protein
VVKAQRPSKASSFVIRMGGDAHQAKHRSIVTWACGSVRKGELQGPALLRPIFSQRSVPIGGHSAIE